MRKLLNWLNTFKSHRSLTWLDERVLRILVIVLLFWIPLYPKFPLIDIKHTWVYIRLEDFLVALSALTLIFLTLKRKIEIKSPLTKPIFLYWLAGAISVIWAIIFFAPKLPDIFSHLVLLHYLRRIEYMLLFFVVVASIRSPKDVTAYLITVFASLFGVIFYGFGQRFLRFPAFLTMNEEFSKGLPLYLPPTARITSTFAGHYDLAAYLVLLIALSVSLIFTLKRWWLKILLIVLTALSFLLLLLTASRISFFAYLLAISAVLFFQKKKILIIPVVALSIFLMQQLTAGTSVRFGKTFRIEPVVFESRTGRPIATLDQFTKPRPTPIELKLAGQVTPTPASPSTGGEDLPLGTGFFALPGASRSLTEPEISRKLIERMVGGEKLTFVLESMEVATISAEMATKSAEFLLAENYIVKRAIVYDISFTTRFQGEWPRAWEAFKRNIFFGSGFSSVSLATDNDYLRSLAETGIFGFLTFWAIIFAIILVTRQILKSSTNLLLRGLAIGLLGGLIGLLFNAVLIDVFEASKVAFVFWMLVGLVIGLAKLYPTFGQSIWRDAWEILSSHLSMIILLSFLIVFCFNSILENYFVGDDFAWLKWAATSRADDLLNYFVNSEGFFYRPLAKVLFFFIQPISLLQPDGYHLMSLFFHFIGVVTVYFLSLKLTGKKLIALLTGLFFLIHPIHEESLFWISCLSGLMAAVFYLLSFLFYLLWREKRSLTQFGFWFLSLLFFILSLTSHELAVTLPLALIFYDLIFKKYQRKWWEEGLLFLPYVIALGGYLLVRYYSGAHGLSGDYSYRLSNLPFNFIGNFLGYLGELLISFRFVPLYQKLRFYLRAKKVFTAVFGLVGLSLISMVTAYLRKRKITPAKIIIFSLGWMVIAFLPFLGLGNISERYAYLASFGFVLALAFFLNWLKGWFTRRKGLKIALAILVVLVIGISSFYYAELSQANRDWQEAGQITKTVLLSLPSSFKEFPAETNLYFVNIPIKKGLAWVFPVGLEEGIWFIYRDESLKIYRSTNLEGAYHLRQKIGGPNWVFLFEDNKLRKVIN